MAANLDNGVILGALGSTFTNTAGEVKPPDGMIIAAIQFIEGTKPDELVAENPDKFFNTEHAANDDPNSDGTTTVDEGTGGILAPPGTVAFPAGMTIYGRWSSFKGVTSTHGGVILYFGY